MQVKFENLGTVNKNVISFEDHTGYKTLEIYFSYKTPVAYWLRGHGNMIVRQNDWSTTTGKLLNELEPDKSKRITGEKFVEQLEMILNHLELNII